MKKLLIASAAAAALLFTACSTSSDVETSKVAQATQAVQTAATISSLLGSNSSVATALQSVNGVISSTSSGASAITIPATALVNGELSDKTKSTLDVVANALVATNTTAQVAKVGAANSFTKKTADYLSSKGVTVENVAKVATSDNKIATGVAILLAQ